MAVGSVEEFLDTFDAQDKLTARQREALGAWSDVEIIFQFTGDEITEQKTFFEKSGFEKGRIKSFLFLVVDLKTDSYNRTKLADMTRAVNRLFAMPVIVLFRHGSALTLAVVHRRAHKRDDSRDVLEKVTLIKDIVLRKPHRAHLDILAALSLPELTATDFDTLHSAWERTLDVEALNQRFYDELSSTLARSADSQTTAPAWAATNVTSSGSLLGCCSSGS